MNNFNKPLYGWFSAEMAALAGTVVWEDTKGRNYTLTCVSETIEHGCSWPDMEFRAIVNKFICRSRHGIFDHFLIADY
jgi:hypothetical protein